MLVVLSVGAILLIPSTPIRLAEQWHITGDRLKNRSSQIIGTHKTPIYIIDNFLTKYECDELISGCQDLKKSTVTRYNNDPDFRTSYTTYFRDRPIEKKIDSRICNLLGVNESLAEQTQIQRYNVGQQFKEHNDAFYEDYDDLYLKDQGQRSWTVMVYLNDVSEGGETVFTKLGESIQPQAGRAVIWRSVNNDWSINEDTNHQGSPVIDGVKYIITKWFH